MNAVKAQNEERTSKYTLHQDSDLIKTSRRVKSISDMIEKPVQINFNTLESFDKDKIIAEEVEFRIDEQIEYPKYLGYYFRK